MNSLTLASDRRRHAGAPRGRRLPAQRMVRLLDVAEAVFLEKGVEESSIDDITARADIAKGTFYHYFATRDAIIAAIAIRYYERLLIKSDDVIKQCYCNGWIFGLNEWIDMIQEDHSLHFHIYSAVFYKKCIYQACLAAETALITSLARLLHEGEAAGAWTVASKDITAQFIVRSSYGMIGHAIIAAGDVAAAAKNAKEFIMRDIIHAL